MFTCKGTTLERSAKCPKNMNFQHFDPWIVRNKLRGSSMASKICVANGGISRTTITMSIMAQIDLNTRLVNCISVLSIRKAKKLSTDWKNIQLMIMGLNSSPSHYKKFKNVQKCRLRSFSIRRSKIGLKMPASGVVFESEPPYDLGLIYYKEWC